VEEVAELEVAVEEQGLGPAVVEVHLLQQQSSGSCRFPADTCLSSVLGLVWLSC
jgi:hypothetical protein